MYGRGATSFKEIQDVARPGSREPPIGEAQAPGERVRQALVVGDDHHGDAEALVEVLQEPVDAIGGPRVEVPGRLVGEEELGLEAERARQGASPPRAAPGG